MIIDNTQRNKNTTCYWVALAFYCVARKQCVGDNYLISTLYICVLKSELQKHNHK